MSRTIPSSRSKARRRTAAPIALARAGVWLAAAAMLGIGAGPFGRAAHESAPSELSPVSNSSESQTPAEEVAGPTELVTAPDFPRTADAEVVPAPSFPRTADAELVPASDSPRTASPRTASIGHRLYRPARVVRMRVTAYSPDARSCGASADGITASGRPVSANGGHLVAADTRLLPFGTLVSIPGYARDTPVPVLDRGGAIKGNRLDVLFPTHERAMKWGVQYLDVTIWEEVPRGPGAPIALRF